MLWTSGIGSFLWSSWWVNDTIAPSRPGRRFFGKRYQPAKAQLLVAFYGKLGYNFVE